MSKFKYGFRKKVGVAAAATALAVGALAALPLTTVKASETNNVPVLDEDIGVKPQGFNLLKLFSLPMPIAENPLDSITDANGLAHAIDATSVDGSATDKVSVEGNTVNLLQSVSDVGNIVIAGDSTDLTLNLGTNTLTFGNGGAINNALSLYTGADLTITGEEGAAITSNGKAATVSAYGGNTFTLEGEATVENTLQSSTAGEGNALFVGVPQANTNDEQVVVNIDGGTLSGRFGASIAPGTNYPVEFNMTSGEIVSTQASAVVVGENSDVTANISGGSLSTNAVGAALNIDGSGTYNISEAAELSVDENLGYGIQIKETSTAEVNVSGGTISSPKTDGWNEVVPRGIQMFGGTANITGGIVNGAESGIGLNNSSVLNVGTEDGTGTATISGEYGISVLDSSIANVYAGKIDASGAAIGFNGSYSNDAKCTVSGGNLVGGTLGVYVPAGTFVMNAPATITAPAGILQRGGSVDLNGGTIIASGEGTFQFGDATVDGEKPEIPVGAYIVDTPSQEGYPEITKSALTGASLDGAILATDDGVVETSDNPFTITAGLFTNPGDDFLTTYAANVENRIGVIPSGSETETYYLGLSAENPELQPGDTVTVYAHGDNYVLNVGANTDLIIKNESGEDISVKNDYGVVTIPAGEEGSPEPQPVDPDNPPQPDDPDLDPNANNAIIEPTQVNVGDEVVITVNVVGIAGEPAHVAFPLEGLELVGEPAVTGDIEFNCGVDSSGYMVYHCDQVSEDVENPTAQIVATFKVTGSNGVRNIPVTFNIGLPSEPTVCNLEYTVGEQTAEYSCTFNANGGKLSDFDGNSVGSPYIYEFNDSTLSTVPVEATRTGYVFLGWYVDGKDGLEPVDPVGYENADGVEFIAEWSKINLNITPLTQQVAYGKTAYVDVVCSYSEPTDSSIPLPEGITVEQGDFQISTDPEIPFITRVSSTTDRGMTLEIALTAPNSDTDILVDASYMSAEPVSALVQAVEVPELGNPEAGTYTVYRLYNPWDGEHLLTQDANEWHVLTSEYDWIGEGVAFYADANRGVPVWRLYNPYNGDHIYTMSTNEYNTLGENGWNQEGRAFYSSTDTDYPVYRLWNKYQAADGGAGSHLWTADYNEYRILPTLDPVGAWQPEGVAWFAAALPQGVE